MKLRAQIARRLHRMKMGAPLHFKTSSDLLNRYVASAPSHQNAIDAVPGWTGALPADMGLNAGTAPLYADSRIAWLLHHCMDVRGCEVLELGPLEAGHTFMLEQAGAAAIDAIEANALAFVRCLIAKEIMRLTHAHFYLGDFNKWLAKTEKRYDLVVASGVLYHSHDPIRLLELIAACTDSIYLWTHYFDEDAMPAQDRRRVPFSEQVELRHSHGVDVRLHERSYYEAWVDPSFCGGLQDQHYWIEKADILSLLRAFGFEHLVIAHDEPDHVNGPGFSVFAQRTSLKAEQASDGEVAAREADDGADEAPVFASGDTSLPAHDAG